TRPEGLGGSRDAGPAIAGPRPPYVTEAVCYSGCGYGYGCSYGYGYGYSCSYGYGYGYGCTGRTGCTREGT
ncbi:hypothetical protein L249_5416, partial [Ophiocordyceps polyrhachis-furcata BCC 54312]